MKGGNERRVEENLKEVEGTLHGDRVKTKY